MLLHNYAEKELNKFVINIETCILKFYTFIIKCMRVKKCVSSINKLRNPRVDGSFLQIMFVEHWY
jgi:hypothetical protein